MYELGHLLEGLRFLKRRLQIAKQGLPQYKGTPQQIANTIVKNCFNGEYFQVSKGNFAVFYIRDFGICVEALLKLGYKKEIEKTLQYCLHVYAMHNKITTTITQNHKPLDVFAYAPDSLAFLLYALRVSGNKYLAEVYKPFLEQQLTFYYTYVLTDQGLIDSKKHFSSMKDNAHTVSSCYNNCMSYMIQQEANKLKLACSFKHFDFKKIIIDNFWTGKYFREELVGNHISGDANTFPFWCKVVDDKKMFKKCLNEIQRVGLDNPFPLQYARQEFDRQQLKLLNIFAQNYEGSTNWMHLGLCYLDVVKRYDKELLQRYLDKYTETIQRYNNFLEVFNQDGTPYHTWFYYCDDGMLWASKYLELRK
ncbi:hypothetical protein HYY69_04220 [Candidatus Woesearchaeota archaeon]|nr:hypothetical protein [Candidatus Woesearchaeota archaeon]